MMPQRMVTKERFSSDSLRRPYTTEALAASAVMLVFLTLAGLLPAQNDTWWHLATGRAIVQDGAIRLVDQFSWTFKGNYWPNHEWLSHVLFFAAYTLGGMPLLTAGGALLAAATVSLVWHSLVGPYLLRCIVLIFPGFLIMVGWSLRPQLFTLCATALTIRLLINQRYQCLPPLFVLWANLHGAVALGLLVLSAACVEALLHSRERLSRVAVWSGLSLLGTLCTPLGFSLFRDVFLSIRRPDYAYVAEWQPAGTEPWSGAVFVVAASLALLGFKHRRSLDDRDRLLAYAVLALMPLAFRYSRNIPVFAIAATPLLNSLVLHTDGVASLFRSGRPRQRPFTRTVLVAAALAAFLVSYAWTIGLSRLGWEPVGPAAADAIRACGQPMYNHFDNGGPLIWFVPEQPVFVDSRQHPYPAEFIVNHFKVEDSGVYGPLFSRYGIRCAVLPPHSKVAHALVRDGWRVTYKDGGSVIAVPP